MPNTPHHRKLTTFASALCLIGPAAAGLPEAQQLIPDQIQAYDGFGSAIAIDGPLAVISASESSLGGSVYVYDTETWSLIQEIHSPDGGFFGHALDLDGTTLAVGAPSVWGHGTTLIGKAYLYDIITGEMLFELEHDYTRYATNFGRSVAVEGDHVAIGTGRADEVSIYDRATGTLRKIITPINDTPAFGGILAISEGSIAINSGTTVEIFDLESGDLQYTLAPDNPDTPDTSVSVSTIAFEGDTLNVGTHQ